MVRFNSTFNINVQYYITLKCLIVVMFRKMLKCIRTFATNDMMLHGYQDRLHTQQYILVVLLL